MSARSSAPSTAAVALAIAAAACSTKHKPEADPARLKPIMRAIDRNAPAPGAVPMCKPEQMIGGATLTQVTVLKLGEDTANPGAERADWINPPELDSPAARELIDPATDETTKRQAAYELLSAPFFLVYRIDLVDAPMALAIKDLRRGFVNGRALRYTPAGDIVCARVMIVAQTLAKSDWAIIKSNLPTIDPKIAQELRDDLRAQFLRAVAALGRPETP